MSYLALARKWRPRTFSQLVGQEHINKVITKSLNQQRLHHAYLFTGTRGVGKTSIARLLAKALNCEQGISAEPCLHCETCLSIEQGHFIDLIEIDGASRTRVEDTRELLENVQYNPTSGRFKIYLIDEVHMLSQHSFNALLKTLEEPPQHVKFLLATTDPQKLPVTVLSRFLQFSLRHIPIQIISQQLQHILNDEQLSYDIEAIELIAKAAKGSMRDALSLLDQAIASADDKLFAKEVKAILGYTQQDYALQILAALVSLDGHTLITVSRQIAEEGGHFGYVLDELLDYLHQIMICHCITSDNPLIRAQAEISVLANQLSPEDTQLFYQIGLRGSEEMHLAPTLAIGFEMVLLRMLAFKPASAINRPALAHELVSTSPSIPSFSTPATTATPPIAPKAAAPLDWSTLIRQLNLTGLTLNAAENAELIGKSGREIALRVDKGHLSLFTPALTQRLEQALGNHFSESIKIKLRCDEPVQLSPAQQKQTVLNLQHQAAEKALEEDSFFQQLKQEFSAEIVKNSMVPAKDEL